MDKEKNSHAPGRPVTQVDRRVVDALIEATAQLLQEKSRSDITVREIAQAANVNPAMINYYFQGKNGLFQIFIEHLARRFNEAMQDLERSLESLDVERENPTRLIIASVIRVLSDNATGLKLLASEIQLNSELKDAYTARHASHTTKILKRILARLVERGIYRQDLEITYTAFALETLLSQHVINSGIMKAAFGIEPDPAIIEGWIDYLTGIFDRGFRAAPA